MPPAYQCRPAHHCLQGVEGLVGPQGDQGPEGVMGVQGLEGPMGVQGLEGPMGVQGLEGPMGVQGLEGPMGVQGLEGPMGVQVGMACDSCWGAVASRLLLLFCLSTANPPHPLITLRQPVSVTIASSLPVPPCSSLSPGSRGPCWPPRRPGCPGIPRSRRRDLHVHD